MTESSDTEADETPNTVERKSGDSFFKRIASRLVLSLLLGGLFWLLMQKTGLELRPSADAWARVSWPLVTTYLVLLVVTHFFRASRWRYLIRPVRNLPLKEVIALNWIGFFAIFAFPLRLGEVARPALTKIRHGISVSIGFGTIAVERVLDGLVTSLCVAWALFALPRLETDNSYAQGVPYYGYLALTIFACAFMALGVFLWKRAWAVRTTETVIGLVNKRFARLLADKVDGVAEGIRSLSSPSLTAGFLFETLLYWGFNAAGMWILGLACGLPMTFGHAVAIMGILAIGILMPSAPGLFGPFQLAVNAGLQLYFAASLSEGAGSPGVMYIFLLFVIQAIFIVVVGVIPLYAFNLKMGDLLGTSAIREGLSVPPPKGPETETTEELL